ncbi:hypothetical protein SELMODRAFT_232195 [Selaginella moellendorffii]|uniref:Uncharacterized protein n=1 Tax=Selaginella moellendorffii TaxID=88036 RepID=D8RS63_SELML|nr:uncharacterized protein LOC9656647 [Selaginella moellendorffii]EFJ24815.1 hypothetical protein SELMODRAFT_232195 [Selaginella moellendorffii]|eukprot:XP_002973860.1 uncharacterized protein LOC9656647 [Selaginella moellendorffii]
MELAGFLLILSLCATSAHAQTTLVFANNAQGTAGGRRFDSVVGAQGAFTILSDAIAFVQSTFDYSNPSTPKKSVARITFTVDDIGGVAYTSNDQIHLSASYVGDYSGDVAREIRGVMFHEMTHVWQWNGRGGAPGGLIEGIADFVRLKANLAPSHWVKPGAGNRWDEGYDVTARFLDYVNSLSAGFVAKLNAKLATGWSESYFQDLTGKSVGTLWSDYKKKYS